MKVTIEQGWTLEHAVTIAQLYDKAFGDKFSAVINDKHQRIILLAKSFMPKFSYVARVENKIVGLAGFQTTKGSLTSAMTGQLLLKELGLLKGLKACLLFSLFEREAQSQELVMDGIVVDSDYRGLGIGSKLLDAIIEYAKDNDYQNVRLDVIDTNPRAKKLYKTKGFYETKTEHFPYLKSLLGFSAATTMRFNCQ
ncbi:GNAT family N-acetyltransferase [Thalassotalea marina]|uniref:Molybdopterin-guanine dinucleotide biosynthesis protein MobC n=1 Tax=Thalassotalea marina TaxID=1673741 RepID=A0A919BKU3_9GAMM|nr:GNAT family N-acetyltransferase [Thalassotalea marina]GHF95886.1 molybdopterin-guanine dinucleotide biosynthesis protein MobC [Thalassotalea marina]